MKKLFQYICGDCGPQDRWQERSTKYIKCECGNRAERYFGARTAPPNNWPLVCAGVRFDEEDGEKALKYYRSKGANIELERDREYGGWFAKYPDKATRRKFLAEYGAHDNDGCYGD